MRTTNPSETDRLVLQLERNRLMREHAILQAESARLKGSTDRHLVRALTTRLRRHATDVHAYAAALHRFHEHVGPLLSNAQPARTTPDERPGRTTPDERPGAAEPDERPGAAEPDERPGAAEPDERPGADERPDPEDDDGAGRAPTR